MLKDDRIDTCPSCGVEGWMYQQIRIDLDHNDGVTQYASGQCYIWVCAKCGFEVGGLNG